jgi:uncharacterized protein (TIGR03905 family)
MITYNTNGVCAEAVRFDLRDGKVYSVSFDGGCPGNLKALGILVEGMDAQELVSKLKGVRCGGKKTSCSDQLATAVALAVEQAK